MIKTLLFDLGDVIIGLDFERAYRAAAELSRYTPQEIPEVIGRTRLAESYECGEISSQAFYQQFCGLLEISVPFGEFCHLWHDMFHPEPLLSDSFLAALAGRQRLVLLSNTNELHFSGIHARFPILRHFDDFVLSFQVGAMKPAAEIFQEAIRRAQCEPDECLFVDDKLVNVEGARRFGIDAVRFRGAESLETELQKRGVSWS